MAFARRHVGETDAPDVVAETFLVAWRRWDDVTDPPIAWLLVTARRVIANRDRSARRRRALADRVALLDGAAAATEDAADAALRRRDALERLAALGEHHREALLLVSWDGLGHEEAAAVAGVRPATFRRRVSRARALLEAGLPRPSPPATRSATPHAVTHLVPTEDHR